MQKGVQGLPPDVYYEDVEIGFSYISPERTITRQDILAFAELTGDRTPIHTDPEFCSRRPFRRPIAHGAFGLSLMVGLKSQLKLYVNSSVAALGWDKVKYVRPLLEGDTVHARIRYESKRVSRTNPAHGIVQEHIELINHRREVVAEGEHFIMLEMRANREKQPANGLGRADANGGL